ncbi:MAG: sigma-54-dependent Fis family transcriptional regulator [Archangium gephyra]|uniref:Sigma-54-dependent Fis family transcriptional regulator n=1 Tax=Archangium gephyra TaxID=48 RepID=A0A2W5ST62_9BACT|nr:MAG: sigma-54-dependent Fis family transcriptional regulator [Archangium gephyra]
MHAADLNHEQLLRLDKDGGTIHFAGHRALLMDPASLGVLRKCLVENVGVAATRAVLTRFGFEHGWKTAESMQRDFEWDSEEERQRAGLRLLVLEGLFRVETPSALLGEEGVMALDSYEAHEHLAQFGRSDTSTCWTICGLLSGYLSQATGQPVFVLEERCVGRGHAACQLVARTGDAWGPTRAADLRFFAAEPLTEVLGQSLMQATETLKLTERQLREHRRALVNVGAELEEPSGIVARSPAMRATVDLARRVAKVDARVLITGESGAGKERIARLVHDDSSRALGPFVAINCGAITETLLESELFGHARGAFTGANQERAGLFEAANKGTLLLDEIGEISPGMQVKLLRVLQEREVRRVGETRSRPIDVRVLASTNRDLSTSVAEGSFRQDLYYRLKVVELHVPPLRERREDVMPLAQLLLTNAALREKRTIEGVAPEAAAELLRYPWPGNVRELENTMERAVALARGARVELEDLSLEEPAPVDEVVLPPGAVRPLEEIEKDYIIAALDRNDGNQTHTALQLKIGSATLYRKLKRYGLITARGTPSH